ncbi:MAG TPA: hypothetical protein VGP56_02430 [Gaiellaceae bacterium]|nr:hypothetical protein [Gaiellaceae bacterium]
MRTRRAAALAALALAASGCSSSSTPTKSAALPVGGPPKVVRVALADLLWPLDPGKAQTRDQLVLARMLFSTPLRTGADGRLRPDLCTSWRTIGKSLHLRCTHADAIAAHLRRKTAWQVTVPAEHMVVVRTKAKVEDLPYVLTEPWAAPPGVPGPFRLISASPRRVVAERDGVRVDVRKLAPFAALKLFRAGRLDEAPVPLGDIRATKLDPQLAPALRVRRLLAADGVVFSHRVPRKIFEVYDDTADRADYQALVPEFEAPPAESLSERGKPSASKAAIALRDARQRIPGLPRRAVRFARPRDPTLAYGSSLLVAAWRDLGLGAIAAGGTDAELERLLAPYPRTRALTTLAQGKHLIPIAWVADARLVSPRLRGWRENELGSVDYSRVRLRDRSRHP